MQNHLTKWAIVHTDSSLLFLVAESCRLEVELGNCNQTSFGFVPEHLVVLTLLEVHLYILVYSED